jgi:hypothetical protein
MRALHFSGRVIFRLSVSRAQIRMRGLPQLRNVARRRTLANQARCVADRRASEHFLKKIPGGQ